MKSRLADMCRAAEEQKQNRPACDAVITDFIKETSTDVKTLAAIASDQYLPNFLRIVFKSLTKEQFPAPSEGIILPFYVQTLQFLTTIGSNHPDLMNAIAAAAPMDDLPSVFFGRNVSKDRLIDPQSSHLLVSLKFLLVVSCSRSLSIASTPSLHVLFVVLLQLLNVRPLCALATAILSGLAHNCPSAADFLRTMPNFLALRDQLVHLLGSKDHNVVLAAMSAITGLYSVGSDAQVFARLALKGLVSPPSLPMATALCTWTLMDLGALSSLIPPSYVDIANALLDSNGMRALHILSLLKEVCANGVDCLPILREDNLFAPILNFVVHSKCDFVTAAGAQFIQAITERAHGLRLDSDVIHLFGTALDIVMMAHSETSVLRIESLLLVLRALIGMEAYAGKWTKILKANEFNLLAGLRMQIDSNNAFAALAYFLLLVDCIPLHSELQPKLAQIVRDTPFCSLVVNILSHSSNRTVLNDACRAAAVISTGISPAKFSPLINTLVSEFVTCNKMMATRVAASVSDNDKIGVRIKHCLQDQGAVGKTYEKLIKMKRESECLVAATGSEVAVSREQILHLKEEIRIRTKKGRDLKNTVNQLDKEIAQLRTELIHKEQMLKDRDQVTATLKDRIRVYKEVELQLKEVTVSKELLAKENADLRQDLANARRLGELNATAAENEKTGRKQTEARILDLSNELTNTQKRLHKQEALSTKAKKHIQNLEALLKQKDERLVVTEGINQSLRNQINELQEHLDNASRTAEETNNTINELREQLRETEAKNNDQISLREFIHKLTENKGLETSLEETFSDSEM